MSQPHPEVRVILENGDMDIVVGSHIQTEDGQLLVMDKSSSIKAIYARGSWRFARINNAGM